jgi:hypothetical protein
MDKKVRVELGENDLPIRIFRKDKKWLQCDNWIWLTKKDAVGLIRLQVFERTGGRVVDGETAELGKCEGCERPIRWETFEQHEKQFKGRGGEVSLQNCIALCGNCHQWGPNAAHKDRRWQTAKLK